MSDGSQRNEMARRVLAESIALQHLVAADLLVTPLPPLARRWHPVPLSILAVALAVVVLGLCGWFVA
jgi:hypothetical protein